MQNISKQGTPGAGLYGMACSFALLGLAACGGSGGGGDSSPAGPTTPHAASLHGTAFGGRQPIIGSTVTVYAASLAAGAAATQIGQATTDANGAFNISAFSPAPVNGQLIYVAVRGGDAGGGTNPAIQLMTVAGNFCGGGAGCAFPDNVNVNELSTVAATSVLQHQIGIPACSAITGNNLTGQCVAIAGATGLAQRANTFAALVNPATGLASPFISNAANGAAVALTLQKLNSLADLLASCVNSPGGSAGDGSACGNLFQQTGTASDTLVSALQIATSPIYNARGAALYAQLNAPFVYTPAVSAAPADWTVGGQRSSYVAGSTGISVYGVDTFTGSLNTGAPVTATAQTVEALDPRARFFYSVGGDQNVSISSVDPATGSLSPTGSLSLAAYAGTAALTVDPSGRFLYIAEEGSGVLAYAINQADGTLTPVAGSPFAVNGSAVSVTVDPSGRFAYVVGDTVLLSAYTVDAGNGALTPMTGSPLSSAGASALHAVTVDPSGRFLYAADPGNNTVAAFTLDAVSGLPSPISGMPFATGGTGSAALSADPGGRFLYIANGGSGTVSGYTIDGGSGALTAIAGSPFATSGSQPVSVSVDSVGRFAYVADATASTVASYTIDQTSGALSAPSNGFSQTAPGTDYFYRNIVDPSGRFVYTVDVVNSVISGYAIDPATGAQVPIPGLPYPAGAQFSLEALRLDPSGHYLIASEIENSSTSYLAVFAIDAGSGALTPVSGSPFLMPGQNPVEVEFDSTGRFVYTFDNFTSTISAFSFDPATGALTALSGFPISTVTYPQAAAASPVVPFLYVIGSQNFQVGGYAVDPSTGALTPVPGSPYYVGTYATVYITPNGRFLYVGSYVSGALGTAAYAIDPVTGALTAIPGSPFSSISIPQQFASDPASRFLYAIDGNGALDGYAIDGGGALTAVPGSPYSAGGKNSTMDWVTVDPTGRFAYVLVYIPSKGSSTTASRVYNIDPVTGALTPVNVLSSAATTATPQAVVLSP